jgi:tetratricopeptide (TPR) repeat protein
VLAGRQKPKELVAAEEAFREVVRLRKQLVDKFGNIPNYRHQLAGALGNLGRILTENNRPDEGLPFLEEAIVFQEQLIRNHPEQDEYRRFYANNLAFKGVALTKVGEHIAAAQLVPKLLEVFPNEANTSYNAACILAQCASEAAKDTRLSPEKQQEMARQYAERAMKLLRQAVQEGYHDVQSLQEDPDLNALRGREEFKQLLKEMMKD